MTTIQLKRKPVHLDRRLQTPTQLLLEIQTEDGAIGWFADGIWDAWNHTEGAMALEVMGEHEAADRAFSYLQKTQLADGAWEGDYGNTVPMADLYHMSRESNGTFRDTNFTAYCAVGLWHRYVSRSDEADLRTFWPMVRAAFEFVLSLQSEHGDIAWSTEAKSMGPDDSLRAGNGSIRKSLECAIKIANVLGETQELQTYRRALSMLDEALTNKPERFDRNGEDRMKYAMDWYYPAMGGAVKGHDANMLLRRHWNDFVVPDLGCHCVLTEPWVTIAETAELAITLIGLGGRDIAAELIELQFNHRDEDGAFWMGYQYAEKLYWPLEKPSWTQAAMILAVDALRRGSATERVLASHA